MIRLKQSPVMKELNLVNKEEAKLKKQALESHPSAWKLKLESKLPEKVYDGLESAFCKAFYVVFDKGTAVIEKTYNKDCISKDYEIKDYAVQVKGGRKELRKVARDAKSSNKFNMAISTVEGIGLGALGVGLPDIVLFVGMILKGIYETAMNYGIDYEKPCERLLILKMMETAMAKGEDWSTANEQVDRLMQDMAVVSVSEEELKKQIERTAKVFAVDMLLLKFVQGLPVVGMLGGAANPIYYQKVMKYVQLKYRKRYLWSHMKGQEE